MPRLFLPIIARLKHAISVKNVAYRLFLPLTVDHHHLLFFSRILLTVKNSPLEPQLETQIVQLSIFNFPPFNEIPNFPSLSLQ